MKTVQLLNQLCNESQGSNTIKRDACSGCFFRANNQLLSMAKCADSYLNNTNYGHCQMYLRNATNNINSTSNPPIIYCSFLECVRQVNKNALIGKCINEAIRQMLPTISNDENHLTKLFINTTACILAKTRCGAPNPITGAFQGDELINKLHIPSMNAIFVNSEYDINIVQLPFGNGQFLDDCVKYRNIEQANWPGVKC
ncbi:uncharacterized protein LOC122508515 [Leptopilina heterotoma]|uniref:uncharacterized protein LOC122508515 n=1 Tax=Leptopilina heterotoma TaxID=63436 RepID=UPI001CA8E5A6|nr:uncharacterized protein LOC122508515 [Leptopilina heterotoma]XP_043477862.1 uncharacterized protein LOC122508515 [Leptopilina heterotoma]XP_043477863.1 uncharacterized protein LOC122508515 [Leptopilina heterotoma]